VKGLSRLTEILHLMLFIGRRLKEEHHLVDLGIDNTKIGPEEIGREVLD
jgi:hypothetical protein